MQNQTSEYTTEAVASKVLAKCTPPHVDWLDVDCPAGTSSRIARITHLHSEICGAPRRTLESAIRAGELLTKQKSFVAPGHWTEWCSDNLPQIHERTIRRYVQLWENSEWLKLNFQSDTVSDEPIGIRAALEALQLRDKAKPVEAEEPSLFGDGQEVPGNDQARSQNELIAVHPLDTQEPTYRWDTPKPNPAPEPMRALQPAGKAKPVEKVQPVQSEAPKAKGQSTIPEEIREKIHSLTNTFSNLLFRECDPCDCVAVLDQAIKRLGQTRDEYSKK